jgi:Plasmid recombination enzyme
MYCITRIKKVKDRKQINLAANHNFRLRFSRSVDKEKTIDNEILFNSLNVDVNDTSSLQNRLTDYYKSLGIKERKDNVLMLEFIATASPEFFENKSKEEINSWAQHQLDFYKNKFGEQLKVAVLHLDEKTPHLHIMISTEQKTVKRYKNQRGTFFKESWSLNAKRYNPAFLQNYQSEFAKWNEKYGLKRGKSSTKTNISPKKYFEIIDKEIEELKKIRKKAEGFDQFFLEVYPKIKKTVTDTLTVLDNLVEILKTKDLTDEEISYIKNIENKYKNSKLKSPAQTPQGLSRFAD